MKLVDGQFNIKNQPINRIIGIDLLRVTSILYIVGFWHINSYTKAIPYYNNFVTIRLAYITLGTFVFISGYLIGLKNILISKHSVLHFYQKRLLRIYPLYLIAIGLFTFFHMSDLITSLKAACLVSMLVKKAPPTLWFIPMLMLFYIISPFVIVVCRTNKISQLLLYCSCLITCLLLYNKLTKLLDIRVIMYFPAFILGVYVSNNGKNIFLQKSHIVFLLLIISILVSFIETTHKSTKLLLNTPLIVLCSYLLFRGSSEIAVSSNRVYKSIILMSYSSYCMYLFHRPLYVILTKIYFPKAYLSQVVYLVLFCLPCIIISSFIIQKLYDILIGTLTSKLRSRKSCAADLSVIQKESEK
jgi:peptidoglycan/LPS O-acetylase OafA/YrhL